MVLVRYRSSLVFSLGSWSTQIQTGFHVSDPTWGYIAIYILAYKYGAFTLYGLPSQVILLYGIHIVCFTGCRKYTSQHHRPNGLSLQEGGLDCSRFARHYSGNLAFDFFSSATEIFQFTECPSARGGSLNRVGFPHSEILEYNAS
jgi:hypothetical protein